MTKRQYKKIQKRRGFKSYKRYRKYLYWVRFWSSRIPKYSLLPVKDMLNRVDKYPPTMDPDSLEFWTSRMQASGIDVSSILGGGTK